MNLHKQPILLCLLVLLHLHLVTGNYFSFANPWNLNPWNLLSWYRSKNVTVPRSVGSLVDRMDNLTAVTALIGKEMKNYGHVLTPEENRLMNNLAGVISNIRRGKSSLKREETATSTSTAPSSTTVATSQTPLDEVDLIASESESATTFIPFNVNSRANEATERYPSTIAPQPTTAALGETTTERRQNDLNERLSTTSMPALATEDSSLTTYETGENNENTIATTQVQAVVTETPTTTLPPFRMLLNSDPVVSWLVGETTTQVVSTEQSASAASTQIPENMPVSAEVSNQTEATVSTAESVVALEATTQKDTPAELTAFSTTAAATMQPVVTEGSAIVTELTTELPTMQSEQFIREVIALRERQIKRVRVNTEANTEVTHQRQSTTTGTSEEVSPEVSTAVSVEINTRQSIAHMPLFVFLSKAQQEGETTTTRISFSTEDAELERENRKLPFAFYDNQPAGKPVDEGHFVSTFQDFYSDSRIFDKMMPVHSDAEIAKENHIEVPNSWFVKDEQIR